MSDSVWIKPSGPTFGPNCIVAVVPQIHTVPHVSHAGRRVNECRAVHVAYSYRSYPRWTSPVYLRLEPDNSFHDWLERFAQLRKRTYVVAPHATSALVYTGFFDRITERGAVWAKRKGKPAGRSVLGPAPSETKKGGGGRRPIESGSSQSQSAQYQFSGFIDNINCQTIKYRVAGKSFVWASGTNYFRLSEDDIATAVGFRWPLGESGGPSSGQTNRAAGERAFLWLRAMQRLADWWREVDGGPWGFTAGMLAFSFLKKRIPAKTVLKHDNEYAGRIEESAIFGGRRSVWFLGNVGFPASWNKSPGNRPPRSELPDIPGRIVHVDVRSMYPYLLATQRFPIQLLSCAPVREVKSLKECLGKFGVIARVRIRTAVPEYPYRHGANTVYPIGEFTTTLAGDELDAAISENSVIHCMAACLYRLGTPFTDAAKQLIQLRAEALAESESAWELFVKTISNAMAGKLAQRKYEWAERPAVCPRVEWGEWITENAQTGKVSRYRAMAGLVQERVDSIWHPRPMTAAFVYLTMYGRMMMRNLRQLIPPRLVVSQDTDGIWGRESALEYLPIVGTDRIAAAGELRVTASAKCARFWSPQHYWYDGNYILSGFGSANVDPATLRVTSKENATLLAGSNAPPLHVTYERDIIKHLGSMPVGGITQGDGWVSPLEVCEPPLEL